MRVAADENGNEVSSLYSLTLHPEIIRILALLHQPCDRWPRGLWDETCVGPVVAFVG